MEPETQTNLTRTVIQTPKTLQTPQTGCTLKTYCLFNRTTHTRTRKILSETTPTVHRNRYLFCEEFSPVYQHHKRVDTKTSEYHGQLRRSVTIHKHTLQRNYKNHQGKI